ncbi:unnamed protein product [Vitrella brassicaformis CCMP3155]|uniref:Uncharacterized protein n=2 Tax=Vitrella brassicaformis TaxID=1169539 RepID=A0A0G4GV96_VITBC|nr:unnamed protein product [Vitrella brassicaformis CCMP3155]|mmetsp:Transcript_29548/g.73582  ORF Transcript_29548/g.73582 Transcript_29548/m.73582 type:complete len:115 (+) Transcript_29548:278-622(+)|eukprot:CEM34584.1 unnamed protein product [Vitrella brassicaformis CCMP3155]
MAFGTCCFAFSLAFTADEVAFYQIRLDRSPVQLVRYLQVEHFSRVGMDGISFLYGLTPSRDGRGMRWWRSRRWPWRFWRSVWTSICPSLLKLPIAGVASGSGGRGRKEGGGMRE